MTLGEARAIYNQQQAEKIEMLEDATLIGALAGMSKAPRKNGSTYSEESSYDRTEKNGVSRKVQNGKATASKGEAGSGGTGSSGTTRVGRWMSQAEYDKMMKTGYVQESTSSTTHVANPASQSAFGKQAKPGSIYVEFDVPTSSVKATGSEWGKIVGPNSLEGRLAAKKGLPVPQMPKASNIEIVGGK